MKLTHSNLFRGRKQRLMFRLYYLTSLLVFFIWILLPTVPQTTANAQLASRNATVIVWKPNGSEFAVGYSNGELEIRSGATGQVLSELSGHSFNIRAIAWHPTLNQLISASDEELFLWNTETGQLTVDLHNTYNFPRLVTSVSWSRDGQKIIIFTNESDEVLQIWQSQTYQKLAGYFGGAAMNDIVWSPNGEQILTSTMGGVILREGADLDVISGVENGGGYGPVAWAPNSEWVAISNWLGGVQIWNVSTGNFQQERIIQPALFETPDYPTTSVLALQFNSTGTELLSVGGNGTFTKFDADSGSILETQQISDISIYVAAFSPNGSQVAYTGDNSSIHVVEPSTPSLLPTAQAGNDQTLTTQTDIATVTLDGSGSSDSGGTIVSYTWSEDTTILANTVTAEVDLPLGVHTITLTVTDDEGTVATDDVVITIVSSACVPTANQPTPTIIVPAGDVASLISAITTANANIDADIISLEEGIYTLSEIDNTSSSGVNGLPIITTDITLYANCSTLERASESDPFRLFEIASEGSLTLYDVTLQGGDSGEYNGGAIYNQGTLTLQFSTLVNNQGNEGGAIASNGTATLEDTTIENNSAINGAAGGLYVSGGTTTITDSTLSGNAAATSGGALSSSNDSVVTITHSLLSGNNATDGGAAFVAGSTFTLDDHTQILNNTASHQGGGLYHANGTLSIYESFIYYNNSLDDGGGIYSLAGPVEITGSILTNNSSLNRGGAIYSSSNLAIDHSSLYDNYAIQGGCLFASGTVTLLSADLSYNTAETGGGVFVESGALSLTDSALTNNSVEESGAGAYIQAGSVNITRGSLSDNTATGYGGAIYNQGILTVTDGFITANHADEQGGGVYNSSTGSNAIQTTCISGNTATDISGVFSLTAAFDATNNWWGASDGPSGSGAGTGDAINANVNVTPFLTDCPH